MTPISIYDVRTGEIVATGGILLLPDFRDQQIAAALAPWGDTSHALVEADSDPGTQYIQTLNGIATVVAKPELAVSIDKFEILADGIDIATLTGLPDPCEIIIDDPDPTVETMTAEVSGGGFEFAAETPGVYTIEVRRFPFLPWSVQIVAF
jgi:hypothetical protein